MMTKHEKGTSEKGQFLDYDTYLNERKLLIGAELDVSSRFDRSILILSGGSFFVSMIFVKEIVKCPNSTYMFLLAWVLFALAICLMLLSLLTSQSALRRQRKILDDNLAVHAVCSTQRNRLGVVTHWLNVLSIASFVMGMVCLFVFVGTNLSDLE